MFVKQVSEKMAVDGRLVLRGLGIKAFRQLASLLHKMASLSGILRGLHQTGVELLDQLRIERLEPNKAFKEVSFDPLNPSAWKRVEQGRWFFEDGHPQSWSSNAYQGV